MDQLALRQEPAKGLKGIKNRITWLLDETEVVDILSKIDKQSHLLF